MELQRGQKQTNRLNKSILAKKAYGSSFFPMFMTVLFATVGCSDSPSSKNKENARLKRQYREALLHKAEAVKQNEALVDKYNALVDKYNTRQAANTVKIRQLGDTINQSNLIVANAIDDVNAMNKALSNFRELYT